ncbi:MAG: hypothetical protein AAF636_11385 [Pseudomonadota bacterium]
MNAEPSNAVILAELKELREEVAELRFSRKRETSCRGIMDTKETAAELNVNEDTVRRWAREKGNKNHLPSIPHRRPLAFRAEIVQAHKRGLRGRELRQLTAA